MGGSRYFSLRYGVVIGGIIYRAATCYPLDSRIMTAVLDLEKQGFARLHESEVRFVSGAAVPLRKAPGEVKTKAPPERQKKRGNRGTKEF